MCRNRLLYVCLAGTLVWIGGHTLTYGDGKASLGRGGDLKPGKPFGIPRRITWTTSRVIGSPDPPLPYRVRRVFPNLDVKYPISVAHEPGTDQILLVHQLKSWIGAGRILRIKDDGKGAESSVLLEIDRTIYGLTFHPNYRRNGFLFIGSNGPVSTADQDIPGKRFRPEAVKTTRVSRFTVQRQPPFACDPKSEKIIIEWPSNGHNGGDLAFGPDGMLYISSGDGTSDSDTDHTGQDLSKLLAKVLRIDVDHPTPGKPYAVPADNPFLKTPGARPETWAYGFRNPWRLHIDQPTGDLWVGNNGQDLWEQIYLVQRGANYGWSVVEGTHPFYPNRKRGPTPFSQPIAEHSHAEARSLTGGLVYRGRALPKLNGAYVYGDWSTGKIWGIRHAKGKVTWHQELADTTLQITGFGTDSKGELLIVDYGGGLYTLEPAPPQAPAAPFPTRLSETGLFASVPEHRPAPGLIPYSVNAPLWSDGADKERFIALPGDSIIDFTADRGWNFSDGAVLVKTFSLGKRRIETRLLTRQQGQWAGYSYIWNDEQTDATLVAAAGMDRTYPNRDGKPQSWHFPSRAECMVCHSRAANFVLGPSTLQMNKDHDYAGAIDNQLRTLEHIGVLGVSRMEHFQEFKRNLQAVRRLFFIPRMLGRRLDQGLNRLEAMLGQPSLHVDRLPRSPWRYPRLVDPADARGDLNLRARSYLHANCSQCHVLAGGGNAAIDLEFATLPAKMALFGVRPQHQSFEIADARLIVPGNPERSVLYQRLARRGPGQMPPLASSVVDQEAVRLVREWIVRMK